ncbi:hypothetical protein [Selenomonas sp. AB3002]|uniref:hypothetical protein n=1 Tax=Selenomonas sp. AB3002 TaxID=1392502 RepID=UPI0004975A72
MRIIARYIGTMIVAFAIIFPVQKIAVASDYYLCAYGNGSYYVVTETVSPTEAAASYAYEAKVKFVPANYPSEYRLLDATILYKNNQWLILRWDSSSGWKTSRVTYDYDYSGYLKDYIVNTYNIRV